MAIRALAPQSAYQVPALSTDPTLANTSLFQIWFTAGEIAELGKAYQLKCVPWSKRGVVKFISRQGWKSVPDLCRMRTGRKGGGGQEYHISLLPESLQAAHHAEAAKRSDLQDRKSHQALEERRQRELETTDLTARQRSVMSARAAILNAVEQSQFEQGQSRRQAIMDLVTSAGPDYELAETINTANDRSKRSCKVSRASLYNWFKMRDEDGVAALAPHLTRHADPLPPWFDGFLKFFARPQKPAAAAALRDYVLSLPDPSSAPNYDQVQRALKKLDKQFGTTARHRGREGRLALKARMAYVIRSTEGLLPTSVFTADGQTFDAEVAHPIHGQAFRPEITSILDVATRRWVGFSVGLAESTLVVIDALRMACEDHGIPAIFYVDRGSGYKNDAVDNPLTGFMGRLGITKLHALPQNSQAKGLIERFNGTTLVPLAKRFDSYIGADMDRQAGQKFHRRSRKELRVYGTSRALPSWAEFLEAMQVEVGAYNDRPHSGLNGATPNEAWARHVAEGFQPISVTAAESDDLFRPYVKRRTRRALVDWLKNKYFHQALEGHHGTDVLVGYDIHDAQNVWVREIDQTEEGERPGKLICVAKFAGNEARYVPLTAERAAIEKRHKGRKRRLQGHMDQVDAELSPMLQIDAKIQTTFDIPTPIKPALVIDNDPAPQPAVAPRLATDGTPIFADDLSLAHWAVDHPDLLKTHHRTVLEDCLQTPATRDFFEMKGVDLTCLRNIVRSTPEA